MIVKLLKNNNTDHTDKNSTPSIIAHIPELLECDLIIVDKIWKIKKSILLY